MYLDYKSPLWGTNKALSYLWTGFCCDAAMLARCPVLCPFTDQKKARWAKPWQKGVFVRVGNALNTCAWGEGERGETGMQLFSSLLTVSGGWLCSFPFFPASDGWRWGPEAVIKWTMSLCDSHARECSTDWFCLVILLINTGGWCGSDGNCHPSVDNVLPGCTWRLAGKVSRVELISLLHTQFQSSQKIFLICRRFRPFRVPWGVKLNRPTACLYLVKRTWPQASFYACVHFKVAHQESGGDTGHRHIH